MSENLKVKILKKSKGSLYPDHIVVKRPALDQFHYPYNDTVHLYFDKGTLMRLIHVQNAPKGQKVWNSKIRQYVELNPKKKIAQEFITQNGKIVYKKEPHHTSIFFWGYTHPNTNYICFFTPRGNFRIMMDAQLKCLPDYTDNSYNAAKIKEVYPHPKRKICPSLKNFKEYVHN